MEGEVVSTKDLITFSHHGTRHVLSFCEIIDSKLGMKYNIFEPKLSERNRQIYHHIYPIIKKTVREEDINLSREHGMNKALEIIEKWTAKSGELLGTTEAIAMAYYVYRDLIGLDILESIYSDSDVTDIICPGLGKPMSVWHNSYGWMNVNGMFRSKFRLEGAIYRLALRSRFSAEGRNILHNGDYVKIGKEMSILIMKQRYSPDENFVLKNKIVTSAALSYLHEVMLKGGRIVIVGPEGSGKTNLLSALTHIEEKNKRVLLAQEFPKIGPDRVNIDSIIIEKGRWSVSKTIQEAAALSPEIIFIDSLDNRTAPFIFQTMNKVPGAYIINSVDIETFMHEIDEKVGVPKSFLCDVDVIIEMGLDRKIREIAEVLHYDYTKGEVLIKSVFVRKEGQLKPLESKFLGSLSDAEKYRMRTRAERFFKISRN